MLKKAQYWREFTAATRAQAESAADTWWAEQSGFDKVSGWTLSLPTPGGPLHWTVTIIYKASERGGETAAIH